MIKIDLDFETRSRKDLTKCGSLPYLLDKKADIVCLAYKVEEEKTELWIPKMPLPKFFEYLPECQLSAHNAQFDMRVWNFIGSRKHRFNKTKLSQWNDIMAICGRFTYPQSLDEAGKVLGMQSPVTTQAMYGGASSGDFSQEQKQTTGYGRGLTPDAIDAIYGTGSSFQPSPYSQGPGMGGGYNSSQFDHAANVEAQIAQSEANKAMKEAAQQAMEASIGGGSPSSPSPSAPSSDKGGPKFAGGGMIDNSTPLRDLFMGIYE